MRGGKQRAVPVHVGGVQHDGSQQRAGVVDAVAASKELDQMPRDTGATVQLQCVAADPLGSQLGARVQHAPPRRRRCRGRGGLRRRAGECRVALLTRLHARGGHLRRHAPQAGGVARCDAGSDQAAEHAPPQLQADRRGARLEQRAGHRRRGGQPQSRAARHLPRQHLLPQPGVVHARVAVLCHLEERVRRVKRLERPAQPQARQHCARGHVHSWERCPLADGWPRGVGSGVRQETDEVLRRLDGALDRTAVQRRPRARLTRKLRGHGKQNGLDRTAVQARCCSDTAAARETAARRALPSLLRFNGRQLQPRLQQRKRGQRIVDAASIGVRAHQGRVGRRRGCQWAAGMHIAARVTQLQQQRVQRALGWRQGAVPVGVGGAGVVCRLSRHGSRQERRHERGVGGSLPAGDGRGGRRRPVVKWRGRVGGPQCERRPPQHRQAGDRVAEGRRGRRNQLCLRRRRHIGRRRLRAGGGAGGGRRRRREDAARLTHGERHWAQAGRRRAGGERRRARRRRRAQRLGSGTLLLAPRAQALRLVRRHLPLSLEVGGRARQHLRVERVASHEVLEQGARLGGGLGAPARDEQRAHDARIQRDDHHGSRCRVGGRPGEGQHVCAPAGRALSEAVADSGWLQHSRRGYRAGQR